MGIKVTGVYLAAGQSRRMGVPKLSIPLNNKGKMGGFAFARALESGLNHIVVVLREGGLPDWLPYQEDDSVLQYRCSFVVAAEAERGMAYSLQTGLQAAVEEDVPDAILVVLADQPFINTEMLDRLIHVFESDPSLDYVACGDKGVAKPPVLLAASMFEALRGLKGDEGARKLLLQPEFRGRMLEESDQRLFVDLDTPQDVEMFSCIDK
ncbi:MULTISPECIES: nucleotidyltransferase family protein [unclassified Paenibacillus]|uniref:nucleotidyltransferase family protein n=1 Tax=unclassified Paenibacillus TaxID=185978 RepID=UPI003641E488